MSYKKKSIVGIIPVRMSSSRFYGKPLAKILNKEMLFWVYEHSKESKLLDDIYVATDDSEIEKFCINNNIKCVLTSPKHKCCSDRTNEACHIINAKFVLEIQGDEPTLMAEDMDIFIKKSFDSESQISILCTDLDYNEINNLNVVKLVFDKESKALFFSRSAIPNNFKSKVVNYYKQIGLYFWSAEMLKIFSETPIGTLEKIEDSHTLRFIENHYDVFMVYTANDTIGVDLPQHIKAAEDYLRTMMH